MASKRQALGRGLDALFPAGDRPARATVVRQVGVDQIMPNPRRPRMVLDPDKLAELAASIAVHGLIQPLVVTETVEGFVLIAGERRWRASRLAGAGQGPGVSLLHIPRRRTAISCRSPWVPYHLKKKKKNSQNPQAHFTPQSIDASSSRQVITTHSLMSALRLRRDTIYKKRKEWQQ